MLAASETRLADGTNPGEKSNHDERFDCKENPLVIHNLARRHGKRDSHAAATLSCHSHAPN